MVALLLKWQAKNPVTYLSLLALFLEHGILSVGLINSANQFYRSQAELEAGAHIKLGQNSV